MVPYLKLHGKVLPLSLSPSSLYHHIITTLEHHHSNHHHNSVVLSANDAKPKQTPSSSNKERTVQAKPLPLPPHAEIQLELQEQEMLKLERFGKVLAGPNTDLGIERNLKFPLFHLPIPFYYYPICG